MTFMGYASHPLWTGTIYLRLILFKLGIITIKCDWLSGICPGRSKHIYTIERANPFRRRYLSQRGFAARVTSRANGASSSPNRAVWIHLGRDETTIYILCRIAHNLIEHAPPIGIPSTQHEMCFSRRLDTLTQGVRTSDWQKSRRANTQSARHIKANRCAYTSLQYSQIHTHTDTVSRLCRIKHVPLCLTRLIV